MAQTITNFFPITFFLFVLWSEMVNFYEDDDPEGEAPVVKTQAELTLQNLLQKQLSTAHRLERVEFEEVTQSMYCIGHASSGVGTLAQFRENELRKEENDYEQPGKNQAPPQKFLKDLNKQKSYGPHPAFLQHALEEAQKQRKRHHSNQVQESGGRHRNWSRHSEELEASLMRGKDKLKAISHLSAGESACRKPLLNNVELSEMCKGSTPQDRARSKAEKECTRSTAEVFSSPAPGVLDLQAYIDEKHWEQKNNDTELNNRPIACESLKVSSTECQAQLQVPNLSTSSGDVISEMEILSNKLSEDEIREIQGGKFANYAPGIPSHILYIKNLSPDVKEADLAALYIRFQSPGKKLLFRLMQHGRMKGQAFVTFPDTETAKLALQLTNGFRLKGKPVVIQYGRAVRQNDKSTD